MKITFKDGVHYATYTAKNGKIFMGYAPDREDAINYCAELVFGNQEVTA
jgi:hypothetical protein